MTVPISMSIFSFLYYRKNIFSTISLLKSKRVSLCHKRKLPSLIKFRKKFKQKEQKNKKNKTKNKYTQIIYENISSFKNPHIDIEYWTYEGVSLPLVLYWYPSLYDMHFNQDVSACLGLCFTPMRITVHLPFITKC